MQIAHLNLELLTSLFFPNIYEYIDRESRTNLGCADFIKNTRMYGYHYHSLKALTNN